MATEKHKPVFHRRISGMQIACCCWRPRQQFAPYSSTSHRKESII